MPTIAHLRRLAKLLPGAVVYTRAECIRQGHPFDPPCAYLSVTDASGKTAKVCVDGEAYLSQGDARETVFRVDITKPRLAAQQVRFGPEDPA